MTLAKDRGHERGWWWVGTPTDRVTVDGGLVVVEEILHGFERRDHVLSGVVPVHGVPTNVSQTE